MTPESEARCRELIDLLLETNRAFNLTAVREPEAAWTKHILDSLQALETGLFEETKSLIDIGAGAGFPGLPLALACPGLRLTSVEGTGKKCNFIREMLDHFGLPGESVNERAELLARNPKYRERFDVATARAVGNMSEVAEYCLPFVRVGGHVVLWRGRDAEREAQEVEEALDELGGFLTSVTPYELPGWEGTYYLVVIEKTNATPRIYPRGVGVPKARPLAAEL